MTLNWQVRGEKRTSFIALFGEDRKFAIKFMLLFNLTNLAFFKLIGSLSGKICILIYKAVPEISDFR